MFVSSVACAIWHISNILDEVIEWSCIMNPWNNNTKFDNLWNDESMAVDHLLDEKEAKFRACHHGRECGSWKQTHQIYSSSQVQNLDLKRREGVIL